MLVAACSAPGSPSSRFGLAPSYGHCCRDGVVGLTNAVFHPADYALLSAKIPTYRLGRAFSIHTFSGFLGNAVAPVTMLALVGLVGLSFGLTRPESSRWSSRCRWRWRAASRREYRRRRTAGAPHFGGSARSGGMTAILTPAILGLTGFFALMSLSGSGISNFSVVALNSAFEPRCRSPIWR